VQQIRYTSYVPGHEPMNLPTLRFYKDEKGRSQFFDQYEEVRQLYFTKERTLSFILKLDGKWIWPGTPQEFCSRLSRVCTNPAYGCVDRMYNISVPEIFEQVTSLKDWCYKHFRVAANCDSRGELELCGPGETNAVMQIPGPHIVASFVLMHYRGKVILTSLPALGAVPKGGWSYDVPGGRVSDLDADLEDAAIREVFEETGLLIDRARIMPCGIKYDPHGRLVHRPVVPVYFAYQLNDGEFGFLQNATCDTKGHRFDWFVLADLAEQILQDSSLCHVPSHVVSRLSEGAA
jgi:8-oxo-dGTP pyrophosphatase MutT (NUDIX family)